MATATTTTMRAIVQDGYGSVDVLRAAQLARPEPGANEVLVRVQAAGLDRGTWHLMTGTPYPSGSRSASAARAIRSRDEMSPA